MLLLSPQQTSIRSRVCCEGFREWREVAGLNIISLGSRWQRALL